MTTPTAPATSTLGQVQSPFDRVEMAFIAAFALIAPFPLVYVLGAAIEHEPGWEWRTLAGLVRTDSMTNVVLVAPLMIATVWIYDRIDSWWIERTRAIVHNGPHLAFMTLSMAFLFLGNDRAALLALWLMAIWVFSLFARPIIAQFRRRAPH